MKRILWIIVLLPMTLWAQDENKAIFGKTVGKLPYLKYGPGTDRLGGAKMTYLDTAIVLNIVDSMQSDYIVQLSKRNQAFIPKSSLQIIPNYLTSPYVLTGSWSAYGRDEADYVGISLSRKLPYRSMQEINPSRIIVDILGAVNNTNWITQLSSLQEVKNVYHEQIEDDIFRVIITLKHRQHWGHSLYYEGDRLVIKVNHPPRKLKIRDLKIAIDAGHGGSNTGATGLTTGIQEKEYTLLFAKELKHVLERKGAQVLMTREADISIETSDRMIMLNKENPDILISLHLNSSSNKNVQGVSTYYRHIGFRPLSQKILNRMLDLNLHEFGNVGSFNFTLNGPTDYPNCLVEIAFLSNIEDEKRIMDPKFRKKTALQIFRGVKDWLRSERRH